MSDMGPDKDGITYSFSFRSVQEKQNVNEDGTLANPQVSNKILLKYQNASAIFKSKHYKQSKDDLDKRMNAFLG